MTFALSDILAMTARAFQMPVAMLQTPSKLADVVLARRAYGELARRYTPHSSTVIARPINASPSAVSVGWRRFALHLRQNTEFSKRFAALDAALAATNSRAPERLKTRPKLPRREVSASTRAREIVHEFHTCKREITRIEKAYENGF